MNDTQDMRKCIIVTGMGRSGSSALTRVLNILGVSLGPCADDADSANPTGFWEHRDIRRLSESLWSEVGEHWELLRPMPPEIWTSKLVEKVQHEIHSILARDFTHEPLWAVKDMRMTRFLRIWEPLFPKVFCEPHFIIVFRHPLEVAASQLKAFGRPPEEAQAIWLARNLDAEEFSRGYPRVFVSFDLLIHNWRAAVDIISERLDITWPIAPHTVSDRIEGFLNPTRKHNANSHERILLEEVKTLYGALLSAENEWKHELAQTFGALGSQLAERTNHPLTQALINHIERGRPQSQEPTPLTRVRSFAAVIRRFQAYRRSVWENG